MDLRRPLLPRGRGNLTTRHVQKHDERSADESEEEEGRKRLLSLKTLTKGSSGYATEKRHRPRRHRTDRRTKETGGDESRVSVYCVGDAVSCKELLKRLEGGRVERPDGLWVDALWENAIHSYLREKEDDQETFVQDLPPRDIELTDDDANQRQFETTDEEAPAPSLASPRASLRRALLDDEELKTNNGTPRRRRFARNRSSANAPNPPALEEDESHAYPWKQQAFVKKRRKTKHMFSLSFGCVVLWGFEKTEERLIIAGLLADDAVVSGATSAAERVEAHDTMTFCVDDTNTTTCANDLIRLSSDDPLEKFSLAYAMAQSAKLFIWEARVDETINEVKHIPERLALTGHTDLTEKQISQMIGKVFIERTQVNLHSDILDVPDFLWEDDHHEPAYNDLKMHLDVPERVALLNDRLDILKELLEVLNTQLSNHHSSRLEIIVIWLIVAEILVSLLAIVADRLFPIKYHG